MVAIGFLIARGRHAETGREISDGGTSAGPLVMDGADVVLQDCETPRYFRTARTRR